MILSTVVHCGILVLSEFYACVLNHCTAVTWSQAWDHLMSLDSQAVDILQAQITDRIVEAMRCSLQLWLCLLLCLQYILYIIYYYILLSIYHMIICNRFNSCHILRSLISRRTPSTTLRPTFSGRWAMPWRHSKRLQLTRRTKSLQAGHPPGRDPNAGGWWIFWAAIISYYPSLSITILNFS